MDVNGLYKKAKLKFKNL